MLLQDYDFPLPEELIAQAPAERRDASRLMVLERCGGGIEERKFSDLPEFLSPGDLLVVNDARVIPARLLGHKESGGKVEMFLVRPSQQGGEWECLLRASKPPRPGTLLQFAEGVTATVRERRGESWIVSFAGCDDFRGWLERAGRMPLPPYIKREPQREDRERYQTVFAAVDGAVAAPTAGLHMTPALLGELKGKGVEIVSLTLHVGLGTFLPIREDDLSRHRMHSERYCISAATAERVNAARREGRRVVALGTTATRALEHAAQPDGTVPAGEGEADIFIRPGYRFRVVQGLITNFHLPRSTLLLLVSAFAGRERVLAAYGEAVRRRFRFFSYGDAMFLR